MSSDVTTVWHPRGHNNIGDQRMEREQTTFFTWPTYQYYLSVGWCMNTLNETMSKKAALVCVYLCVSEQLIVFGSVLTAYMFLLVGCKDSAFWH